MAPRCTAPTPSTHCHKQETPLPARRRNPVPPPDYTRFRKHLTRYEIDAILHHRHWIPNLRYPDLEPGEPASWKRLSITGRFFAKYHPGWNLATMCAAFENAGIILRRTRNGPHSGRCHWQLKALHLNSPEDFVVEWDETVTKDDGRYYYGGKPDTPTGDEPLGSA